MFLWQTLFFCFCFDFIYSSISDKRASISSSVIPIVSSSAFSVLASRPSSITFNLSMAISNSFSILLGELVVVSSSGVVIGPLVVVVVALLVVVGACVVDALIFSISMAISNSSSILFVEVVVVGG